MKHLYAIHEEGETYAADSEQQARECYIEMVGDEPDFVRQLNDDDRVPNDPQYEDAGKTYAQVAAECSQPCQIWSQYQ